MARHQPQIVKEIRCADNCWQLELCITPDLYWFQGHFAEAPILPGVVQLNWARQQAMRLWPEAHAWLAQAGAMESIKFQQVIRPGEQVLLELTLDDARQRLTFSYVSADSAAGKKFASGRLVAVS
ncbi:3-hydroxyacyl-ACP dehydratase FabZ family protein [Simiduia aestuariiviva]|uniref:3-hydroxymyristoyl/3-hydroxydecanoyl-(Acyl carrier protein) dehydratase n=1 Tax=Simiduia aestuariiviva TaxID=1510459 RepID=A0A839UV74_9GAMM|nr:hypothetical protein [Simiduia aestuariiviva]MBB3169255.1 3-hydroxymyristoyl/3-hydroxydecanoyl-(acyl carrier protein) dehydratase [Simiduia aestuariiviva]